jgi:ribose-phosphate pyrophosphokinase
MITLIPSTDFIQEAKALCEKNTNFRFAETELRIFANSEIKPRILADESFIKDQDVLILASCVGCNGRCAGDKVIEVAFLADAAKRMGAKNISLVMPYLAFSPQDKIFMAGESLSSEVIIKMLESTPIDKFYVFDLHNEDILKFATKPFKHLSALPLFVKHAKEIITNSVDKTEFVVAALDKGSKKRNSELATALGLEMVEFDKSRDRTTGLVTFHELHGNVEGKVVFSFDDYTSTGGTHIQAYEFLKKCKAKEFHLLLTHVIVEEVLAKMLDAGMDFVVTTNSTAIEKHEDRNKGLIVLDIFSTILAEEFERAFNTESLSQQMQS